MADITDDRAEFEREIFKPPHFARLLDIAGEFVGRLDRADYDYFLSAAMERLWGKRGGINVANDINRLWVAALQETANSRPRWEIWTGSAWKCVNGKHLRSLK